MMVQNCTQVLDREIDRFLQDFAPAVAGTARATRLQPVFRDGLLDWLDDLSHGRPAALDAARIENAACLIELLAHLWQSVTAIRQERPDGTIICYRCRTSSGNAHWVMVEAGESVLRIAAAADPAGADELARRVRAFVGGLVMAAEHAAIARA